MARNFIRLKTSDDAVPGSGNVIDAFVYLTHDEVKASYMAYLASKEWATNYVMHESFSGEYSGGHVNLTTGSLPAGMTSIGTFTDTVRDDSVGTHPTDGATTTVNTYTFYQDQDTHTDSPRESTFYFDPDVGINETVGADNYEFFGQAIVEAMVVDQTVVGQYYLSQTAPASGTWTEVASISDTQVDGTTATKKLWIKTELDSPPSSDKIVPVTTDEDRTSTQTGDGVLRPLTENEMTYTGATLISGWMTNYGSANTNSIGTYVFDTSAPGTGTWQQMGETMTDQVKDTATYAYAGTYTGSFSGTYTGSYTGSYAGSYEGTYSADYGGFAGTPYTGYYDGTRNHTYEGEYTGSYSSDYTGYYDGVTIVSTSSTVESKKLFVRIG